VHAAASGNYMVVWDRGGMMHTLLIAWNCIGWQSLVLLGMTFLSGLRGEQPLEARVQIVFIGIAGTMLLNLMRVAAVAALAATWGQTPAVLFHDYGGTILVVGWLFAFWIFVQRWLLRPEPAGEWEEAVA
jgi:exosortase/archaeosortase family protein